MMLDIAEREERAKLLEEEYAKLNKSINRNMYTYRIIDIINSIAKQKKGIDQIIAVSCWKVASMPLNPVFPSPLFKCCASSV
jgi:hypothetical protein